MKLEQYKRMLSRIEMSIIVHYTLGREKIILKIVDVMTITADNTKII